MTELLRGYAGKGHLLGPESYREYYREQLDDSHFISDGRNAEHPYDGDYNPALFIGHSALGYVGHSGGDAGVSTWMYFDKAELTGRFIMVNTDLGDRSKELVYYAIWDKMGTHLELKSPRP